MLRFSMGDMIRNISRVDQAVCWPDFAAPYSTKPSAELSSCFRLTLSCCSTTSTVNEVQWYARYAIKLVIYALVHVMLSYLLCPVMISQRNLKGEYYGCIISSKVRPRQIEEHVFSLLHMCSSANLTPAEQS